jgi:signal transduction histidine kinase
MSRSTRHLVDSDLMARSRPVILVVDGDPASRMKLRELISPVATVIDVGSGEAALDIANRHEFAAILIDVDLPDADGFATVTRLRLFPSTRNVPVLFLWHTSPEWFSERRGYELGALGYLRKPVDHTALRAKLDVLLTLHQRGVELREKTREAQVRDIYMGVLGHDLRTPLSAILMSARSLLMQGELTVKDRGVVARMARNAERMAGLIRDILDYTRNQAGQALPLARRPTDIGDICSEIVEELGLVHPDRTIVVSHNAELGGDWDRERVEQVLSNLIGNALEHGDGNVLVSCDGTDPQMVVVRVHNHGNTIPEELLPTLFEPFQRGSSTRFGLGLGLYIVREVVRAHGGTVGVTSTPESGTIFTTRWPR